MKIEIFYYVKHLLIKYLYQIEHRELFHLKLKYLYINSVLEFIFRRSNLDKSNSKERTLVLSRM